MKGYVKKRSWNSRLRRACAFWLLLAAVCMICTGACAFAANISGQTRAASVWENAYFAIDGENLYGTMSAYADARGILLLGGNDRTVELPFVYLPQNSEITGDSIEVTLEFEPGASKNVNVLRYDLTARKLGAHTDRSQNAWLLSWKPDIKAQTDAGIFDVRVQIQADIRTASGSTVLKTEGILTAVFSEQGSQEPGTDTPEDSDRPEESSKPQDSNQPGESDGAQDSDQPGESDGTQDSDQPGESDGTQDSDQPGESDGQHDTERPGESDGPQDSGGADETDSFGETDETGEVPGSTDDSVWGGADNGAVSTGGPVSWSGQGGDGESPTAPPKLRIAACTVDSSEIHPGDTVNIQVTLKNSSAVSAVKDVRIVYESATGELLPVNATNSIYVDSIGASGTFDLSFPMAVGYTLTLDSQKIILTMEFTDEDAAALTSTENIFLKITPSFDLKIDQPSMAPSVEAGSAQDITVNVYNTGGSVVKNVICSLTMEGVTSAGSAFGGDVAAGASASIVLHTLIGKLPVTSAADSGSISGGEGSLSGDGSAAAGMADVTVDDGSGAAGTSEVNGSSAAGTAEANGSSTAGATGGSKAPASGSGYGQTTGVILVQYEDEKGNEYSQEVSVTTQIIPPEGEEPAEVVEKSSQWWISIVFGLVAVQAVIFILIGIHRRRSI